MPPLFRSAPREFRDLSAEEIDNLTNALRDYPKPTVSRNVVEEYVKDTRRRISSLPIHLTTIVPRITNDIAERERCGQLCLMHAHLRQDLMNSIFSELKHEIEYAAPKFLYPLFFHNLLTPEQEAFVRAIEPVPEMWVKNFDAEANKAPNREVYRYLNKNPHGNDGRQVSRWLKSAGGCTACILSRLASMKVLMALLMCLRARVSRQRYSKSLRVRWLEACLIVHRKGNGLEAIRKAYAFGEDIRKIWRNMRVRVRLGQLEDPLAGTDTGLMSSLELSNSNQTSAPSSDSQRTTEEVYGQAFGSRNVPGVPSTPTTTTGTQPQVALTTPRTISDDFSKSWSPSVGARISVESEKNLAVCNELPPIGHSSAESGYEITDHDLSGPWDPRYGSRHYTNDEGDSDVEPLLKQFQSEAYSAPSFARGSSARTSIQSPAELSIGQCGDIDEDPFNDSPTPQQIALAPSEHIVPLEPFLRPTSSIYSTTTTLPVRPPSRSSVNSHATYAVSEYSNWDDLPPIPPLFSDRLKRNAEVSLPMPPPEDFVSSQDYVRSYVPLRHAAVSPPPSPPHVYQPKPDPMNPYYWEPPN